MGLFEKIGQKFNSRKIVYMPITGKVITLSEIKDGVFSEGILGKGVGIIPEEGIVYAPFDGEVILIADTKHAIGLKSTQGVELIIHVGMDTVEMNGKGFSQQVKVGDSIKCGQQIMTFSLEEISKSGYATTTAVIVTNSDKFKAIEVLLEGHQEKQKELLSLS